VATRLANEAVPLATFLATCDEARKPASRVPQSFSRRRQNACPRPCEQRGNGGADRRSQQDANGSPKGCIGSQFFPSKDPTSSLIATFGVFAAGFLMRPVGSLVFGYIGDRTAGLDRVSVPGCRSGPAPAVHSASGQSQNAPRSSKNTTEVACLDAVWARHSGNLLGDDTDKQHRLMQHLVMLQVAQVGVSMIAMALWVLKPDSLDGASPAIAGARSSRP